MIDLHAHVVLPDVMGRAGKYGPELFREADGTPGFRVGEYRLVGVPYEGTPFMELSLRVEAMDAAGIEIQVLSPNPLTYFHHIEAPVAAEFCKWHNDSMAEAVSLYPTRLAGFAQLPVQDPALAAQELERSVTKLGLVGAYFGTDLAGGLHSPAMDELWAMATALDVPVFLHPGPHGIDGPPGDERLREWGLDLYLGFAFEESLAVSQLLFGGVLDRHPLLDCSVSHGGGATAWLMERMEIAAQTRPGIEEALRKPGAVRARLRRLWWDAHVGGEAARRFLMETMGSERLLPGTNFCGWDSGHSLVDAHTGDEQPDGAIHDHTPTELDLTELLDANARRVLRNRI